MSIPAIAKEVSIIAEAFHTRAINLGQLVASLEPLVESVCEDAERNRLRSYWGGIEEIYALGLDEQRGPSESELRVVRENLDRLESAFEKLGNSSRA